MSENKDGGPAFPSVTTLEQRKFFTADEVSGMTLRQYAAIHLKVPQSGVDWLDDMIREARRDELVGGYLAGIIANPESPMPDYQQCVEYANKIADAILKAKGGE